MVVVDIRNIFAVRNVEIIEINDDFIYYAEEKEGRGPQQSVFAGV